MSKEILKELEYTVREVVRVCDDKSFAPLVGVELRFVLDLEGMEDIKNVRNTLPDLYTKIKECIDSQNEEGD